LYGRSTAAPHARKIRVSVAMAPLPALVIFAAVWRARQILRELKHKQNQVELKSIFPSRKTRRAIEAAPQNPIRQNNL
jgi:hypothetical protein